MKNRILSAILALSFISLAAASPAEAPKDEPTPIWGETPHERPTCVKGIHLTSWWTGSKKARNRFEPLLAETEINTVVIAVKEFSGEVYIPGVKWPKELEEDMKARDLHPYTRAMPDIESYVSFLKDRGIYVIARIVVFQDQLLPKLRPEWAVRSSTPIAKAVEKGFENDLWVDYRGLAWSDPTNKNAHDYNLRVAQRAAELGFQGIQFDYIRFPSDGNTRWAQYSAAYAKQDRPKAIALFLKEARNRLKDHDVEISIDTFGLAGSISDDLGIGQKLDDIIHNIDVLSPMMYPSHYAKGEYGIEDPNKSPYKTVYKTVKDTLEVLEGTGIELRPFLQDFSLGYKYGKEEVRAQIEAAADNGVHEWLLWNPKCVYTKEALMPTNVN